MKYDINKEHLNRIINESIRKVVTESQDECFAEGCDEDLDEGFFTDLVDKGRAARDTFRKGGSYDAHLANRQLQRTRGDIDNLKRKYGYTGGNENTYVKSQISGQIDQINQKYDDMIAQLDNEKKSVEQKRNTEIAKVKGKAQQKWDKFSNQKKELTNQKNKQYYQRHQAMKRNPYGDFE